MESAVRQTFAKRRAHIESIETALQNHHAQSEPQETREQAAETSEPTTQETMTKDEFAYWCAEHPGVVVALAQGTSIDAIAAAHNITIER